MLASRDKWMYFADYVNCIRGDIYQLDTDDIVNLEERRQMGLPGHFPRQLRRMFYRRCGGDVCVGSRPSRGEEDNRVLYDQLQPMVSPEMGHFSEFWTTCFTSV